MTKFLKAFAASLILVIVLLQFALAGRGTITISNVSANGGGVYTLTVNSTTGMAVGDHLGARTASTIGPGGIWAISSVVNATSILVTDTLTEENGTTFGTPIAGDGWYSTPTATSGLSRPPHTAKAWDAAMRRDHYLVDSLKQPKDVVLTDLANLTPQKGDIFTYDGTNLVRLAVGVNGRVLKANSAATAGIEWGVDVTGGGGGGGSPHALLDGDQNLDTVDAAPVRGAVIIGNSTPLWARVLNGSVGTVLASDGTDTSFRTLTQFVNDNVTESTGALFYYNGTNWVALAAGTNGHALTLSGGVPTWALPGSTTGGTGQTTWTTGDMLYASGANTLAKRAAGTNGQVLTMSGGVPTWAAASGGLTSPVAETDGGTGETTYTAGDLLYGSGTNTLDKLPAGTDGQVLTLASGVPSWANPTGTGALYQDYQATGTAETYPLDAAVLVNTGDEIEFYCSALSVTGGGGREISFAGTLLTPALAQGGTGDEVIRGRIMRTSATSVHYTIETVCSGALPLIVKGDLTGITPDLEDGGQDLLVEVQASSVLYSLSVIKVGNAGAGGGSSSSGAGSGWPVATVRWDASTVWLNDGDSLGTTVAPKKFWSAIEGVGGYSTYFRLFGHAAYGQPVFRVDSDGTGYEGFEFSGTQITSCAARYAGDGGENACLLGRKGEIWAVARPNAITGDHFIGPFEGTDSGVDSFTGLTINASGQVVAAITLASTTHSITSSVTLSAGTTYLLRLKGDRSTWRLWINGVEDTSLTVSGTPGTKWAGSLIPGMATASYTNVYFGVGGRAWGGVATDKMWDGWIHELAAYDFCLSDAQASAQTDHLIAKWGITP